MLNDLINQWSKVMERTYSALLNSCINWELKKQGYLKTKKKSHKGWNIKIQEPYVRPKPWLVCANC